MDRPSTQDEVDKLKARIQKQKEDHTAAILSTRALIETLRLTTTQTQELYQRTNVELESVKGKSKECVDKAKERKKKIASLEEQIAELRKQKQAEAVKAFKGAEPFQVNGGSRKNSFAPSPMEPVIRERSHSVASGQSSSRIARTFQSAYPIDSSSAASSPPSEWTAAKPNVVVTHVDDNKKSNTVSSPRQRPRKTFSFEGSFTPDDQKSSGAATDPPPLLTARSQSSLKRGSADTPGSIEPLGKRLQLTVKTTMGGTKKDEQLQVKTVAYGEWTVNDTINILKKKLPATHSNYGLYYRMGGRTSSLKMLVQDKKLSYYYKQLEDPKVTLVFQEKAQVKKGGKNTLKRIFGRDHKLQIGDLYQSIKEQDVGKIRELIELFPQSELEDANQFGQTPLHMAVNSNNPEMTAVFLEHYLNHSMDANMPDNHGWTPLHHAVSATTGNPSDEVILEQFLDHSGVQVDVSNNDSNTPLHYFCQKFSSPSCQRLGEKLIKKAPQTVNRKNKNGETPLHKAIFNPTTRVLMVKLLIGHGADVNIPNTRAGETALHYAVRLGRKDLIKILLQAGADMTLKDNVKKFTPYDLAVDTKQEDLKNTLYGVDELRKWLIGLNLSQHFPAFLKEELYLDVIAWSDDSTIKYALDRLKINDPQVREAFKDACDLLKETISRKNFVRRMNEASNRKLSGAAEYLPNPADAKLEKQKIAQLQDTLGTLSPKSIEPMDSNSTPEWLISHLDIEFTKQLGTGRSGVVFKGLFKGAKTAIKVLSANQSEATMDEFRKEFHVMSHIRSPNVVHFFGACLEPRLCIVMEYCSKGSLWHVLSETDVSKSGVMDWKRGIDFAVQMAEALVFLHNFTPQIFHRDMKSLNLLVNAEWKVKICDFGLARFKTAQMMETFTKLCGTFSYAAPEMYLGTTYTDKSDVYSCGIILWEIATRIVKGKYEPPYTVEYPHLQKDYQIMHNVAKKDLRPTTPSGCLPAVAALINRCYDKDPAKRPSANEMLDSLRDVQKEVGLPVYETKYDGPPLPS